MPHRALEPGYEGKRYGMCSDKVLHLVRKIHPDGMADVQCSADVDIAKEQPPGNVNVPMCQDCVLLHFGRTI